MKRSYLVILATAAFASASPALAIDKVYSPNVVKHELEIEYAGSRTFSPDADRNDAESHEFELEYTPTDRLKLEFEGGYEKEPGEKLRFEAREFGGIYQFFEPGEKWADVALKVMYVNAASRDGDDALEVKLLAEKQTGHFLHRINIGVETPLASHSATERSVQWNTRYLLNKHFNPGIEIQSDLGTTAENGTFDKQEHYAGPAVFGTLVPGLKYEAAWYWGISHAASRNAARMLLEYEHYF